MIHTSYFASKAPRERKVSIAKYAPRYWQGPQARLLAPSNPKAENWQEAYLQDLEQRFPEGAGLREYLEKITAETPNPILCCYEKDPRDCHRGILAAYVKEHLGLDICEWRPRERQISIFEE